MDSLSDSARTRLILVARPRVKSLAEAARTSRELAAIGIANQHLAINGMMPEQDTGDALTTRMIASWVVNSSLAATGTAHPVLTARAATEAPEIARVRDALAARHAVVPVQAEDPVDAARLRALNGRAAVPA